jgi:hypothetical protein
MPEAQTKVVFFPYLFASQELSLGIGDCLRDGSAFKPEWDEAALTCDLSDGSNWATADIAFTVKPAEGAAWVPDLLPEGERKTPAVGLVGSLHCSSTFLRRRVDGTVNVDARSGRLVVSLKRAELKGKVDLTVYVVRVADQDADLRYASDKSARLIDSRTVTLYIDAPEQRLGPGLKIEWENFTDSKHPFRRQRAGALFHLDTVGEPKLFLNSDADPDLCAVLKEQAPRGRKATVRNALFAAIGVPVWEGLVRAALGSVPEEGDDLPEPGWQRNVLQQVARVAEPDCDDLEAARRFVRDLRHGQNSIEEKLPVILAELVELRKKAELLARVSQ